MQKKPFFSFDKSAFRERVALLLIRLSLTESSPEAFMTAFLHRSILNEFEFESSNERLEFLGDAVLELAATEALFLKFPDKAEGELTDIRSALVRGKNLARISESLGFGDMILLSKGERLAGGASNPYILANTFEAFLGALYLEKGYDVAKAFVARHVLSTLDTILSESLHIDPKSRLQEISQEVFGVAPNYEIESESGFDHEKTYIISVSIQDKKLAEGMGSSKKKAQSAAAEAALSKEADWNPNFSKKV